MSDKQIKIIPDKGTDPNDTQQKLQEQQGNAFPVVHGKATDAIARMAGKKMEINPHAETASIEEGKVTFTTETKNGTVPGQLGVSTHKLLTRGLIEFSKENHVGGKVQNYEVVFPLKEYAEWCGYDVTEHPKSTEGERKKESARAKSALKNAWRKASKDLRLLRVSNLSWQEGNNYYDCGILSDKGIINGYIYMTFGVKLANVLIKQPITQYPKPLFQIDERHENAYSIGLKLSEHYYMDSNQRRGSNQSLQVETLLEYTNLPSISTVRKTRKSWYQMIKDPLEKALDALFKCGLLENWEYTHAKGEPIPDNPDNEEWFVYEAWVKLYVHFTLADPEDQTERIERRNKERKKRQSQQKSTNKKKTDKK